MNMRFLESERFDRLALGMMTVVVMAALGALTPTALRILRPPPALPPPRLVEPPPAAVLLPDELSRDLKGVFIIVSDNVAGVVFGTAFQVDAQGNLLTTAHLVQGTRGLRLIDGTGGSHSARLVGVDPASDLAEVRSDLGGLPLAFADTTTLTGGDPIAVLASPKNGLVPPSTPGIVTDLHADAIWQGTSFTDLLALRADLRPGLEGSPVVGPGGTVLGIVGLRGNVETLDGYAIRSEDARMALKAWAGRPEIPFPLAPLPENLVLKGTDSGRTTGTSTSIQSVQPNRVSRAHDSVVTIQGSGFTAGSPFRVRFLPMASSSGAFDGVRITLANPATISVTILAGQTVQDYRVQVVNGDGTVIDSTVTFSVAP